MVHLTSRVPLFYTYLKAKLNFSLLSQTVCSHKILSGRKPNIAVEKHRISGFFSTNVGEDNIFTFLYQI